MKNGHDDRCQPCGAAADGGRAAGRGLSGASEPFARRLQASDPHGLVRGPCSTVQINLGRRCNLACSHCHLEAGPQRHEEMADAVVERLLALLAASRDVETVDLTGGAPELHPGLRRLVTAVRELNLKLLHRTNLAILLEPEHEDLPGLLAASRASVIASLPCCFEQRFAAQRGAGIFEKAIEGLRRLNRAGFGRSDSELELILVHNPGGPVLPPPQEVLEQEYREVLAQEHDVRFTRLIALTNMPLGRFRATLEKSGQLGCYLQLLQDTFNEQTVPHLMCRSQVSIGWDGRLFDCDFNQAQGVEGLELGELSGLSSFDELRGTQIRVGPHCWGCTAGSGSSCSGALQ